MVDVNEVYENVQSLAQKAKHGTIRVVDFNRYATLSSMDLFNERLGSDRDLYKLGKAITKTSSGMDKQIDQSLRVFYVEDVSTPVVLGLADIPADNELLDKVTYNNRPVKWIPNNKLENYVNSTIDAPTVDYPVYCDLDTKIKVRPNNITPVLISYYKTPATIIWNYTLVGNTPVYNPTGSVNFEWAPAEKINLIVRILGYAGITIRDSELVQYSNVKEQTTP